MDKKRYIIKVNCKLNKEKSVFNNKIFNFFISLNFFFIKKWLLFIKYRNFF